MLTLRFSFEALRDGERVVYIPKEYPCNDDLESFKQTIREVTPGIQGYLTDERVASAMFVGNALSPEELANKQLADYEAGIRAQVEQLMANKRRELGLDQTTVPPEPTDGQQTDGPTSDAGEVAEPPEPIQSEEEQA